MPWFEADFLGFSYGSASSAPSKGWRLRFMPGTNWRSGCACGGLRNSISRLIVPINWRVALTNFLGARKNAPGRKLSPSP